MAKEKKRLSKNAKAALKILNNSKLLVNSKTPDDSQTEQNFKLSDAASKLNTANKPRPDKKRG